jgi:hypothetical protein
MNHETKNIIIDPAYAREQIRKIHRHKLRLHRTYDNRSILYWLAVSVIGLVWMFISIASIQGCSDDDDGDDKAAEISQCKKMADAFEKCIGWDSMNTTLKAAKSECDKADFDNYDRCMFDCEALSADCEVLTTCFDEC